MDSVNNNALKKFKKSVFPELIVWLIFIVLSILMFSCHELWLDEIQAYMISKDASLFDIVFDIPHYEGHPPFFTILLAIFAKSDVSMEIGLRVVSFFFSLIASYLLIFKSPFKRIIRFLLPFTFFVFYQYTVICRPYSLMFAAFMLSAMFFKERNKKPLRYIFSLYLLCLSSSYGLLFSGVLCILWTFEIIKELIDRKKIFNFYKDARFWSLVSILFGAVLIVLLIYPSPNAYASLFYDRKHFYLDLIYTFFMMPADAMVTDVGFHGSLQTLAPNFVNFSMLSIGAYFCSVLIHAILFFVAYIHKKEIYYVATFSSFALLGSFGYLCNHHIGITVLLYIFILWICFDGNNKKRDIPRFFKTLDDKYNNFSSKIAIISLIICMGMSLLWTAVTCFNDFRYNVWYAKDLNNIIEEYNLDEYRIIADWNYKLLNENRTISANSKEAEILYKASDIQENNPFFYSLNPMFPEDYYQFPSSLNYVDAVAYNSKGENYISNFNNSMTNKRYVDHSCLSREEAQEYCLKLGKEGYPDIIIGDPNILGLMGLDVTEVEYLPIYQITVFKAYKYFSNYERSYIYIRKDLYYDREKWPVHNAEYNFEL